MFIKGRSGLVDKERCKTLWQKNRNKEQHYEFNKGGCKNSDLCQ